MAERHVAFVVGIDGYTNLGPEAQLQRAVEDAESVSNRLSTLGYKVTTLARGVTVDQDVFLKRFGIWTNDIQPGDVALFYFAGHGVGMHGANYLVPADMPNLADADEFLFRARALGESDIRDRIREHGASVTVLMLDACRNNPFQTTDRAIALFRGLERVEPTKGVLTIYAAGYGQTALDRLSDTGDPDPNSVFTRVVLAELDKSGINLLDFSEDVREKVAALAQTVGHDQVPAVENQLLGGRSIYLSGAPMTIAPDEVAWKAIQLTLDPGVLRTFATAYPASPHHDEAVTRITLLETLHPQSAAPAATPPVIPAVLPPVAPTTPPPTPPITKVDEPKPDPPVRESAAPASPAPPKPDAALWVRLATSDKPEDIEDFIKRFPQSDLLPGAAARLRVLDDAAWGKARVSGSAAVGRYLDAFPQGAHRNEARARIARLETPPPPKPVPHVFHVPIKHQAQHLNKIIAAPARPKPRPRRAVAATSRGSNCFSFGGERHCQ